MHCNRIARGEQDNARVQSWCCVFMAVISGRADQNSFCLDMQMHRSMRSSVTYIRCAFWLEEDLGYSMASCNLR
jgi:hypothetical protein